MYQPDTQIYRIITKYFGRESAAFLTSREQTGELSFNGINAIDIPVGYISIIAVLVMVWIALARNDSPLTVFLTTILAALFGNAFICGGLSSGDAHYQSRMIPLVALAAVAGVARIVWIESGDVTKAATTNFTAIPLSGSKLE